MIPLMQTFLFHFFHYTEAAEKNYRLVQKKEEKRIFLSDENAFSSFLLILFYTIAARIKVPASPTKAAMVVEAV